MIIIADMKIFRISDLLRIVSVIQRGGCLIVSLSTGSTPRLPQKEKEACVNAHHSKNSADKPRWICRMQFLETWHECSVRVMSATPTVFCVY